MRKVSEVSIEVEKKVAIGRCDDLLKEALADFVGEQGSLSKNECLLFSLAFIKGYRAGLEEE